MILFNTCGEYKVLFDIEFPTVWCYLKTILCGILVLSPVPVLYSKVLLFKVLIYIVFEEVRTGASGSYPVVLRASS